MRKKQIRFKYQIEKFVQFVAYLASKNIPDLDKLKTAKLLYYADKLHLQNFGRPITGDLYYRLDYGPVPTVSLDVMNEVVSDEPLYEEYADTNRQLFLKYLGVVRDQKVHPIFTSLKDPDIEIFSQSEIEIIDTVISKYGNMSGGKLISETHQDSTWKNTPANSPIDFQLFLDDMSDEDRKDLIELLEHDQEDREIFEFV